MENVNTSYNVSILNEKIKECENLISVHIQNFKNELELFKIANQQKQMFDLNELDNFCNHLICTGGDFKDTISDTKQYEKPKKSLTVKLRKLLGYTYP